MSIAGSATLRVFHEPPTLVFDESLRGFCRWAKHRLELLGFMVVEAPYKEDEHIVAWIRSMLKNPAVVVTTDRSFPYNPKIVLPTFFPTNKGVGKPKYEKLYTRLVAELHKLFS